MPIATDAPGATRAPAAVLFDMDGVLLDSEPLVARCAVQLFAEAGHTVTAADFRPYIGTGEDRYLGGVARSMGWDDIVLPAAKGRLYELYLELAPTTLQAFPEARAWPERLRAAGLKVALATSADRVKAEANLAVLGLPLDWWDFAITGEQITHKKPAPDIYLAAARGVGCAPGACVVVEDAINGIEAAKAAGMRCVAVAQTFAAEALRAADRVVPTLAALRWGDLGIAPQGLADAS